MYKIAICDDDEGFLGEMQEQIQGNPEFTEEMTIECFDSGDSLLLQDIRSYTLVILDMCLRPTDGFAVARRIREINEDAVIVFCSGVVEPKPEHFEVQPYRYMIKQADRDRTAIALSEALRFMKQKYYKAYINIASDGKAMKIDTGRVLYFYTKKRGTALKVQGGADSSKMYLELRSNQKIKEWHAELLQSGFESPNVSYLVNMGHIRSVDKNEITMDDGTRIQISRLCKKNFIERFAMFFDKKYRRQTEK